MVTHQYDIVLTSKVKRPNKKTEECMDDACKSKGTRRNDDYKSKGTRRNDDYKSKGTRWNNACKSPKYPYISEKIAGLRRLECWIKYWKWSGYRQDGCTIYCKMICQDAAAGSDCGCCRMVNTIAQVTTIMN